MANHNQYQNTIDEIFHKLFIIHHIWQQKKKSKINELHTIVIFSKNYFTIINSVLYTL